MLLVLAYLAGAQHDERAPSTQRRWSAEVLEIGDGREVQALGDSIRLRVISSGDTSRPREHAQQKYGASRFLPMWIASGEPFIVGDLRYPAELSRQLLGVSDGARLRLVALDDAEPLAQAAVQSSARLEFVVEVRGFDPSVANRPWAFAPEYLVRWTAGERLKTAIDLSWLEHAARLRWLELDDALGAVCAAPDERGAPCPNGALAEALAAVVVGRGGAYGLAVDVRSARHAALEAALRRFAEEPLAARDALSQAGSSDTLVRVLRAVALVDRCWRLPSPWVQQALRRDIAALASELSALTLEDDPLLVTWSLRLVRALHHAGLASAAQLQPWAWYLERDLERSGAVVRAEEWREICATGQHSTTRSTPADNAQKRFALQVGGAARERQRRIAVDNCIECEAALGVHRKVTLELAAAHAEGGAAWERVERMLVMPEVAAAIGVWRSAASQRCENSRVLENATRLSVLSSRWSMGHSY